MNRFLRIIAGIVGGLVIVFGLGQIFGSNAIRNCDDSEIQATIRDLGIQLAPPGLTGNGDPTSEAHKKARADLQISNITEASWNEETEVRICDATFNLKIGMVDVYSDTKMEYSINRSTTDRNTLNVFLKPAA